MPKGRFHHGLRAYFPIFRQNLLLQRTAVHSNPDGNIMYPAAVRHRLHPVLPADIAGVDADFVRPGGGGLQGQLVVKMDIRHQGQRALLPDFPKSPRALQVRHRQPGDLTPGGRQLPELNHSSLHIMGGAVGHRLNLHRSASAYGHAAHLNLLCHLFTVQTIFQCR